jgi:hypothetical protein
VRDAVQPATHCIALFDGASFADQDQDPGLKGVLGIVGVVQDALAHAQHHASLSPHQRRERSLIALAQEVLQQLPISRAAGDAQCKQAVQVRKSGLRGSIQREAVSYRSELRIVQPEGRARSSFFPRGWICTSRWLALG